MKISRNVLAVLALIVYDDGCVAQVSVTDFEFYQGGWRKTEREKSKMSNDNVIDLCNDDDDDNTTEFEVR